jgi:lipopolysaccharide biosynthesis protein
MCTRVAVCFHLGYVDRFNEFTPYIDNVIQCCCSTDIYITYREDINPTEMCLKKYPNAQIFKADHGCDTGAFLLQIKSILASGKKYDYIFKLHTKSNNRSFKTWNTDLLDNIAGSTEQVTTIVNLFRDNQDIGMIGSRRWLLRRDSNYEIFREICKRNKINMEGHFIGGTIFWIRMEIIEKMCPSINISKEYLLCEKGKPSEPSYTHSWERIYGLMVSTCGYKIYGV